MADAQERVRHGVRRARKTRAPRRRVSRRAGRRAARSSALAEIFSAASGRGAPVVGLGAFVAVVEAFGGGLDAKTSRRQVFIGGRRAARQPTTTLDRAARRFGAGKLDQLAQVLAALGSGHRLAILAQLLEGPATYRSLERRTGLKAGPLYHHINQLRLTNLVAPKSRDLYSLTRAGRNALLVVRSLGPLLKDSRPRPVSRATTT